jgi:hypothetical protein
MASSQAITIQRDAEDLSVGDYWQRGSGAADSRCRFATEWQRRRIGYPDMDVVASAMHMSARTLRRRLQKEGTTYVALCDEVREAIAEQLLAMPRIIAGHRGLRRDETAARTSFNNTHAEAGDQCSKAFRSTALPIKK